MFYGFDIYYFIFIVPALLLSLLAQYKVNSTYSKYSKIGSARKLTGSQAARLILDMNGLGHVAIERVAGNLTDHFDPKTNVVRLSDSVYNNYSIAAVGVAAHECGHAVQHAQGYSPMKLRAAIIPITNIGSNLAMPLILLGIVLSIPEIALLGVAAFGLSTLFQLITLPVEFNASGRALAALEGTLDNEERAQAKKVLTAAALTYVAALAVSLANLIRLLLLVRGRNDRRR